MVPDESRKAALAGHELVASFQILELVGEALGHIHDGADASVVRRLMGSIRDRFEKCQKSLDRLPGGALTRADQEAEIRRLEQELERKRALVRRYSEHDVVARVLAQRAMPEKEDEVMEDEGESGAPIVDDDMMKMDTDGFPDVGNMEKSDADDMLIGLGI